jgi:hypothetical protein
MMLFTAPAAVKNIHPSETLSVDKGSAVTLKCNVTGYPRPEIKWRKLVSKLYIIIKPYM